MGSIVHGFLVPGLPHPLLCPEKNEGWNRLRLGFDALAADLRASGATRLLLYSTMWPSVIGHQIQADPSPEWVHVDELFHDLGSIPYRLRIDAPFAESLRAAAEARGLLARTVAYRGFPIDTGSIVALQLLNRTNDLAACIVSSNVYSDRAETVVFGKAARDAILASNERWAVGVVSTLSNRLFTDFIDPADDHIHSAKDEEWNRKLLEFLGDGRLEDVAQLSRAIQRQIRVKKVVNFKPMWWLSACMGQHNRYTGEVHAYAPLYGTGAAVVSLIPRESSVGDKEFDEENVEVFRGDRHVLDGPAPAGAVVAEPHPSEAAGEIPSSHTPSGRIDANLDDVPAPVGAYPHARRVGDMLYLSGVGPRQPRTNEIPGGPIRNAAGEPLPYDIEAQTRATIENVRRILEASGSSLDKVVDVTAFLVDMDRDFTGYNKVYAEYFTSVGATRTTIAIRALPTPIAVELKVIARA
jgi:2-aminomuconate deaminase